MGRGSVGSVSQKLSMVVQAYNPSKWEEEAGGSGVPDRSLPRSESDAVGNRALLSYSLLSLPGFHASHKVSASVPFRMDSPLMLCVCSWLRH